MGAIILQGPHHSAQKSTTTGCGLLTTSWSKLASSTDIVAELSMMIFKKNSSRIESEGEREKHGQVQQSRIGTDSTRPTGVRIGTPRPGTPAPSNGGRFAVRRTLPFLGSFMCSGIKICFSQKTGNVSLRQSGVCQFPIDSGKQIV